MCDFLILAATVAIPVVCVSAVLAYVLAYMMR